MKYLSLVGSESIGEVADMMAVSHTEAIRVGLEQMGRLLTVFDQLDRPELTRLALEFGFEVKWRDSLDAE